MKYFYSQNAGQLIAGQRFHLYAIVGGSAVGVFSTEDTKIEAELSKLADDPKSPVQEISQADYDACIKKNPLPSSTWSPSPVSSPSIVPAIKGTGAVVVSASSESAPAEVAEEAPVEIESQVASTEDALKLGTVTAESNAPEVAEEKSKVKHNWDHKTKKKK